MPALTVAAPTIVLAYDALRVDIAAWQGAQPAPGMLPGTDAIHQLRITTRRLRVALRLFEQMLPAGARSRLNGELRWFGGALGETRDLDVHAENFARSARSAGLAAESLASYALALQRARDAARDNLADVFAGDRRRALAAALEELAAGPPVAALRRWRAFRIDDGARVYLQAARRRLVKHGRRVDGNAPAEELHRLRIGAKRFRYELELFTELYPRLRGVAKAARRLQDVLGEFQDACTAIERLQALLCDAAVQASPAETAAVRQLLDGERERAAAVRGVFADEWRMFEKAAAPGALTKALSGA